MVLMLVLLLFLAIFAVGAADMWGNDSDADEDTLYMNIGMCRSM